MKSAFKIIGIGLVALIASGVYVGMREQAAQKRALVGFADSVLAIRKQQDVQEAALKARFNEIDIDQYLQASKLASSSSVAEGRVLLARYRALLVERDQLAASAVTQFHAVLDTLPEGRIREQVRTGAAKAEDRNRELQATLDKTQIANADAVQAVFDWADRNHALLHVSGTQLLVNGQAPLDELRGLEVRVRETGQAVDDAIHRANTTRSDSLQNLTRLRNDLSK